MNKTPSWEGPGAAENLICRQKNKRKIWWPDQVVNIKRRIHAYFTYLEINIKDPAKQLPSCAKAAVDELGSEWNPQNRCG